MNLPYDDGFLARVHRRKSRRLGRSATNPNFRDLVRDPVPVCRVRCVATAGGVRVTCVHGDLDIDLHLRYG